MVTSLIFLRDLGLMLSYNKSNHI